MAKFIRLKGQLAISRRRCADGLQLLVRHFGEYGKRNRLLGNRFGHRKIPFFVAKRLESGLQVYRQRIMATSFNGVLSEMTCKSMRVSHTNSHKVVDSLAILWHIVHHDRKPAKPRAI